MKLFIKSIFLLMCSARIVASEIDSPMHVSSALNCLDKAINLSMSIKNKNERISIYNSFSELKSDIQIALDQKDYAKVSAAFATKYENSDEILAECKDSDLRVEIISCLESMMKELDALE